MTTTNKPKQAQHYTVRKYRASTPAGYGVQCDEYLQLAGGKPFATEALARDAMQKVIEFGACGLHHEVVPVYKA